MSQSGFVPDPFAYESSQPLAVTQAVPESAHQQILATLKAWATSHPAPDQPALSIADCGQYSPREICDAVEDRSRIGNLVESLILFGAELHGGDFRQVLRSFALESSQEFDNLDRLSIETPK